MEQLSREISHTWTRITFVKCSFWLFKPQCNRWWFGCWYVERFDAWCHTTCQHCFTRFRICGWSDKHLTYHQAQNKNIRVKLTPEIPALITGIARDEIWEPLISSSSIPHRMASNSASSANKTFESAKWLLHSPTFVSLKWWLIIHNNISWWHILCVLTWYVNRTRTNRWGKTTYNRKHFASRKYSFDWKQTSECIRIASVSLLLILILSKTLERCVGSLLTWCGLLLSFLLTLCWLSLCWLSLWWLNLCWLLFQWFVTNSLSSQNCTHHFKILTFFKIFCQFFRI